VARKKTPKVRVNFSESLSRRLREIRRELFGDHGGPELARRLNLPARTWYNYETGVTVPFDVLARFIEFTGANPIFLMTGEGQRFLRPNAEPLLSELSPIELLRRGLEQLERSADGAVIAPSGDPPAEYAAVRVYPLERIGKAELDGSASEGEILALRQWLANPTRTIAVRVTDDAMHPVLPAGSIAAIDRSMTDPRALQGRIVAASPEGTPMIRWLDVSGRHLVFRPNLAGRPFPLVPFEINRDGPSPIIGPVVCSWNRFHDA
jgi:hypothetical protein